MEKRRESDSAAQRHAEPAMIGWLGSQLSIALASTTIKCGEAEVVVDGLFIDAKRVIVAEAFARMGTLKAGQRHKVLADVLKLAFVRNTLQVEHPDKTIECFYVFASDEAARFLLRSGWGAVAASTMIGLQVRVAPLDASIVDLVRAAQLDQDIRRTPK